MDNCFSQQLGFPSCFRFASPCWFLSWQNCFLPFDWKDLISHSLLKTRFVFVLSICFFILNLCFIRFSMSTNSHLSLVRGCTRNRTPLCVPQSNKNFVLAHSFSSYATQDIFASGLKACGKNMVEMMGIEPMTPCLQGRCSPSWATPPYWDVQSLKIEQQIEFPPRKHSLTFQGFCFGLFPNIRKTR